MPVDFAGLVRMEACEKGWITQNMIENQLRSGTRGALEPLSRIILYEARRMGNRG